MRYTAIYFFSLQAVFKLNQSLIGLFQIINLCIVSSTVIPLLPASIDPYGIPPEIRCRNNIPEETFCNVAMFFLIQFPESQEILRISEEFQIWLIAVRFIC